MHHANRCCQQCSATVAVLMCAMLYRPELAPMLRACIHSTSARIFDGRSERDFCFALLLLDRRLTLPDLGFGFFHFWNDCPPPIGWTARSLDLGVPTARPTMYASRDCRSRHFGGLIGLACLGLLPLDRRHSIHSFQWTQLIRVRIRQLSCNRVAPQGESRCLLLVY